MDKLEIISYSDLLLYLDDINEYVNFILLFHNSYDWLDLNEILMYLSGVDEIIDAIKLYLDKEMNY